MKRIFLLLSLGVILLFANGCSSRTPVSTHDSNREYEKFTSQFQDSYSKCTFSTVYVDGESIAEYFKPDLYEYDEITETFIDDIQGYVRKNFSVQGTNYAWSQEDEGNASINFYGPLSDEEYDTSLKKMREYMNSLDYNLEIWDIHETDAISRCTYRQCIDGTPISVFQNTLPYEICADVSKANGIQISLCGVVDDVEEVTAYKVQEFIPLDVVNEILEQYTKLGGGSIYNESIIVDITMQEVEIVYVIDEEGGQYILKPAYEIDVLEDNGRVKLEATYVVDALTGYVECRVDDFDR